jgi:hypothetical protein
VVHDKDGLTSGRHDNQDSQGDTKMQVTEILRQIGGIQSMARELGIDESQAMEGAAALAPAILGGFKKQAQGQPVGLEGLAGMLDGLGGGGLLDDVLAPQPTNVGRGNDVLGQIFGSRDVSRTVAQNAASQTGLDPALLKKMLPIVAMLFAGYMSRQAAAGAAPGSGGGLADLLGGRLGGGQAAAPGGTAGLGSLLDLNGDGNPLDDILGMAGKLLR